MEMLLRTASRTRAGTPVGKAHGTAVGTAASTTKAGTAVGSLTQQVRALRGADAQPCFQGMGNAMAVGNADGQNG